MDEAVVRTRALVKSYRRGARALDGVDIDVRRGEIFGLLGPNGAGKTTFVKCVLGLVRPTSGEITLFGRAPSDARARHSVGFAPETPVFPSYLSAAEVLDMHARLIGLDDDERVRQRDELLTEAEIAVRTVPTGAIRSREPRVRTFSKGMVRRLALAQAFLGPPELLVLDEPTADLDPLGRRDVRNQLVRHRARGATILLNSHLLAEVERICDRVAIVHEGRVLALGPVTEMVPEGTDLETVFVDLIERARQASPLEDTPPEGIEAQA